MGCPSRNELHLYVLGKAEESRCGAIERHVEFCADCQQIAQGFDDADDSFVASLRCFSGGGAFAAEQACVAGVSAIASLAASRCSAAGKALSQVAQPPLRLGQYEVLETLGTGGMGAVYKARHTPLDRVVALKVLPPERLRSQGAVRRFQREIRAVGRLSHPNIVAAHDGGEVDGQHFLVMELVEGVDLSTLVRATGPLPVAEACELVRQAAEGLAHAHAQAMVHRDIKPSNLMLTLTSEGEVVVKILDLGLAMLEEADPALPDELTAHGQTMGTFAYMSPEQGLDSHDVDARADVYSLGATLYKLLTGEAPFPESRYGTPMKLLTALATQPAPSLAEKRADAPAALVEIVDRLLSKDPDERLDSAAAVAEALAPLADAAGLAERLHAAEDVDADASPQWSVDTTRQLGSRSLDDTAPSHDLAFDLQSHQRSKARHEPQEPPQQAPDRLAVGLQRALYLTVSAIGLAAAAAIVIYASSRRDDAGAAGEDDRAVDPAIVVSDVVDSGDASQVEDSPAQDEEIGYEEFLASTLAADRSAAEYVLSIGGRVRVRGEDDPGEYYVSDAADLPVEPFHLMTIDVSNQPFVGEGISVVSQCRRLRMVRLNHVLLDPTCLKYLAACPRLESVSLTNMDLQDEALAPLADCRSLTDLSLASTLVGDQGLVYFRNRALTTLNLTSTRVTDAGLENFSRCNELEFLMLSDTAITDDGLAHLPRQTKLRRLTLAETKVTDDGLAQFAGCAELEAVYLSETQLSDAGLAHFAACKQLDILSLGNTEITDVGVTRLPQDLPLTILDLTGCQISDESLRHFRDLSQLRSLIVPGTRVTDAGLASLIDCRNLRNLSLERSQVTADGVAELRQALPNCQVHWEQQGANADSR
jgi:serine/threonine protein kinase